MDIAAQLRLIRTVRGQTLADIAAGTGLSISYMSDLERWRTNPSLETLEKIAVWHGLQLLVSFVGEMPGSVRVSKRDLEELHALTARLLATENNEENS